MKYTILLIVVLALVAQGCGTLAPAVYGKTRYDMTFGDKLGPDADGVGGQDTTFAVHVVAPAGVKLEDLVNMNYDWNADQSGKIAVSKNATTDTTGQVEIIKAAIEAQTAAFNTGITAGAGLLGQAIPVAGELVGQHMTNQAAQAQTNAANQQALRLQLIPLIDERVGQTQTQITSFMEQVMERLGRLESRLSDTGATATPSP